MCGFLEKRIHARQRETRQYLMVRIRPVGVGPKVDKSFFGNPCLRLDDIARYGQILAKFGTIMPNLGQFWPKAKGNFLIFPKK